MKMKETIIFESVDGKRFDYEALCVEHETKLALHYWLVKKWKERCYNNTGNYTPDTIALKDVAAIIAGCRNTFNIEGITNTYVANRERDEYFGIDRKNTGEGGKIDGHD